MDMIAVELKQLTKRFKNFIAVNNVSLQIKEGEFLFLLGPSGCGKTTTLRMVGGLEEPTSGTITIRGKNVKGIPPEKRDTSTVFQSWALFPHKTVFENVAFGLRMRKMKGAKVRDKVEKFLYMISLEGFEERYPAQLSGGQKQRVALARALVVEPSVLLLDEPLSALDLKLRQRMRFEIKRIQKKLNVTTLFVTHDQTEALAMADRIAVMNKGRLEQLGTPGDLYFQPKNKFITDFIGETNFIPGKIASNGENTVYVTLNSGKTVEVTKSDVTPDNGKVLVAVRPERISMHLEAPENFADMLLEVAIMDVTFLGQLLRIHTDFAGTILMADEFGGVNLADRYRKAKTAYLEIKTKDCMVLPDHG